MSVSQVIFYYLAILLAGLGAVAFYSMRRRKRFEPTPSEDHIFRCRKCALVYTDDPDVDSSRCPNCGMLNNAIEF